jgi:hypothetical protein
MAKIPSLTGYEPTRSILSRTTTQQIDDHSSPTTKRIKMSFGGGLLDTKPQVSRKKSAQSMASGGRSTSAKLLKSLAANLACNNPTARFGPPSFNLWWEY